MEAQGRGEAVSCDRPLVVGSGLPCSPQKRSISIRWYGSTCSMTSVDVLVLCVEALLRFWPWLLWGAPPCCFISTSVVVLVDTSVWRSARPSRGTVLLVDIS